MRTITILFFLCSLGLYSQKSTKDDIDALRVTVMNKAMGLTTDEAAKFWPIYNDYLQKKDNLRKSHRQSLKAKYPDLDKLSDEEANALMEAEISYKQKELDLQKDMIKKIKAAIPPKKAARVFKAEEEFRKVLIIKVKESGSEQ
ncbi:MAG: hypothetical protein IT233_11590 [Bacteroidia bacterium]|nr:hypothetical protein [Bacteroidia bacterium]